MDALTPYPSPDRGRGESGQQIWQSVTAKSVQPARPTRDSMRPVFSRPYGELRLQTIVWLCGELFGYGRQCLPNVTLARRCADRHRDSGLAESRISVTGREEPRD